MHALLFGVLAVRANALTATEATAATFRPAPATYRYTFTSTFQRAWIGV